MPHKRGRSPTSSETIGTYFQVYRGTRSHTAGGLKKSDLIRNKRGSIVSKARSKIAKEKWSRRKHVMMPPYGSLAKYIGLG